MSTLVSPGVNFTFENNNVQSSTPADGVTHVLARTKKGPFNDPSTLITNISQFESLFGSEIVPDGTMSNIELALTFGSKLRICRVAGTGIAQGVGKVATLTDGIWASANTAVSTLTLTISGSGLTSPATITLNIKTREDGSSFGGTTNQFLLKFLQNTAGLVVCKSYNTVTEASVSTTTLLESKSFIKFINGSSTTNSFIDTTIFKNFVNNNKYFEITLNSCSDATVTNMDQVISFLKLYQGTADGTFAISDGTNELSSTANLVYVGTEGNSGAIPTAAQWISSLEYLKDYSEETYQIFCSHLHQHLSNNTDILSVHSALVTYANSIKEFVYYIEVPKYDDSGNARDYLSMEEWTKNCISAVGNSTYVAYFAGGIKMYNSSSDLKENDCIGIVAGLGDSSADSYGEWYHFSGVNRGIVTNAKGLVSPNYGTPSKTSEINDLASNYINTFVIKDTSLYGKQIVLWHNFTSQLEDNSNKYLGITRLCLYIKKNLRPILESYIEEPNTFSTWDSIYRKAKVVMDDLIIDKAITEYTWYGDQSATSYSNMTINNEADVRNGIYKVKLIFKEIVALQTINMDIIIDATSGTVQISNN